MRNTHIIRMAKMMARRDELYGAKLAVELARKLPWPSARDAAKNCIATLRGEGVIRDSWGEGDPNWDVVYKLAD